MKPKTHIISSFLLALVFHYFFRSIAASLSTFLAGVLFDLDHLVDFWISQPQKPFSLKGFLTPAGYMNKNNKAYVPLHSYELIIILWFLSWQTHWHLVLVGLTLGLTLHLILDDIGNELKTFSYILIYRVYKKFRVFREE